MYRFDEQYRDHLMESAARTNESRFPAYDFRPAEPNGKTAAIVLVSIVMGVAVLGFFGLALLRGMV